MPAKEIFLNTKWGKIENNNHHQKREIQRVFGTDDDEDDEMMMREERLNERERARAQRESDGWLFREHLLYNYIEIWFNMRIFLMDKRIYFHS